MRLSVKLTIGLIGVMAVIFLTYAYLGLQSQSLFFREDRARDGKLIGRTLAKAASTIWQTQGREAAIAFVDEINRDYRQVLIRVVKLDDTEGLSDRIHRPSVELSTAEREQLANGPVVVTQTDGPDPDYIFTYVALQGPSDNQTAALELRHSFETASRFVRVSTLRLAALFAVIIISTSGVMWVLGSLFVARPIAQLAEKARQIALGDFSGKIEIKGRDEIASLAGDINTMSERLSEAKSLLDRETTAKIKAVEKLRHADRLTTIGTLASGLAHELGNPLNVLKGHLQLCAKEIPKDSVAQEHLEISNDQAQKMTDIIGHLLDFSRSKTPNREMVDVSAIAQRAIRTLAPFAGKRHALIKFSSDGSSAIANVDATQLEQVITNLLLNAIQSTDGGGDIVVGLDTQQRSHPTSGQKIAQKHIRLSVSDSGHGIDPADREQIFDPFFTTKDVGEGTGMGLSIAYGIVKDHGGWIDVESEPGRGSCFSVFIPQEAAI